MTAASSPEAYPEAASPEDAQGLSCFEVVSASASNIPGLSARQQEKKRQTMIKIMLAREKRMRHFNGPPIDVIDSPVDEPYLSPRSLPYRSADDEDTPRSSSHDGFSLAPEKAEDTEATPLELAPSLDSLRTDTLASQWPGGGEDSDMESNSSGFGLVPLDNEHKDNPTTDDDQTGLDKVADALESPPISSRSASPEMSQATMSACTPSSAAGVPCVPASWESAEKAPAPSTRLRKIYPKKAPDDDSEEGTLAPLGPLPTAEDRELWARFDKLPVPDTLDSPQPDRQIDTPDSQIDTAPIARRRCR